MAINLSALSNAQNTAVALGNLILVSPQKTIGYQAQNSPSWKHDNSALPKTLIFNYEGDQSAMLTSDITDHYIENNTAVQDQIALRPEQITVQGFVGELNDIAPSALQPLKTAADKLTVIGAYTPALSTTALLAYANAFQLYQTAKSTVNSATSTWSSINGAVNGSGDGQAAIDGSGTNVINSSGLTKDIALVPNQTQQQIYFQQFYSYWNKRTLFTVQTPWAIFQDMAIMSLRATQNADTRMISDFEITFKLMRFAATQTSGIPIYNPNGFGGRAANQGAPTVNLGVNQLLPSPVSYSSFFGVG